MGGSSLWQTGTEESTRYSSRLSHAITTHTDDTGDETDERPEDAPRHQSPIRVTFTVATSDFELGRALAATSVEWIEFDQSVSFGEPVQSQFWAETENSDTLVTSLREVSSIETLTSVTEYDNKTLFQVEWATIGGLIDHLHGFDARLLDVVGTAEEWQFDCRFPTGEQLAAFHEACLEDGITVEMTKVRQ